jgi:hypothetical protein
MIRLIGLILLCIAVVILGPTSVIWALNILFPVLAIPYSIKTWGAIIILWQFVRGTASLTVNNKSHNRELRIYMASKYKAGDIVQHKATGDRLLILRVVDGTTCYSHEDPPCYTVRLPNYSTAQINEFELENVQKEPAHLSSIKVQG